ncbi:helix-turn-helix domain-containing protein [Butyricicoccus sp.]
MRQESNHPSKSETKIDVKKLAQIVSHERYRKGWSQRKAAKLCGLTRNSYMQIEEGATQNPRPATVERIAAVYDIDIKRLMYADSGEISDCVQLVEELRRIQAEKKAVSKKISAMEKELMELRAEFNEYDQKINDMLAQRDDI